MRGLAGLALLLALAACGGGRSNPTPAPAPPPTAPPAVRSASELVEALPLTDRIVMLHFDDGYVVHHGLHQKRSDETVRVTPLDTDAAMVAASYSISSGADTTYAGGRAPISVGRKSKGTDFAWFCDQWTGTRCVNSRVDHAAEHWVYLTLPSPMKRGTTYAVSTGGLAQNGREWTITFDETRTRSEAVHVNVLGYPPPAPKFAYLSHWAGDLGAVDLGGYAGNTCRVIDQASGESVFTGALTLRKTATNPETAQAQDSPPHGNFIGADVYECDFSSLTRPGRYVVAVDGVGSSFAFAIDADVYREAFRVTARGLYHNRSGIALSAPHTEFTRPAPHNPRVTPGFSDRLVYTTSRFVDWKDGDFSPDDVPAITSGIKGPIESAGWYQDAGDWDGYYSHLRVTQELLTVYEMAPRRFSDGELNIPESGNGVPDIVDEAAWLPRFGRGLRAELMERGWGSGGIGLRVCGDHFGSDGEGVASYEDVNRQWIVSGEDPWSTFRYAGAAAQLAHALTLSGRRDPEGVDWVREAREAYAWAIAHTRTGDEEMQPPSAPVALRQPRAYAAAALFRVTGDRSYEKQLQADTAGVGAGTNLLDEERWAPFVYVLGGGKAQRDGATLERLRAAVLSTADAVARETPSRRAMRWGGQWSMPMLVGQQTTPWIIEGAVGYTITRDSDPPRAAAYLASLYTTADYFLGANALNMAWVTGLGPRGPQHIFHIDAWYNGRGRMHPGLIPYGPWRKETDVAAGPWDKAWPHQTLYPANVDLWPGNERYFDNRCSPMTNEFTIHQNTAPAAAIFGFLSADRP